MMLFGTLIEGVHPISLQKNDFENRFVSVLIPFFLLSKHQNSYARNKVDVFKTKTPPSVQCSRLRSRSKKWSQYLWKIWNWVSRKVNISSGCVNFELSSLARKKTKSISALLRSPTRIYSVLTVDGSIQVSSFGDLWVLLRRSVKSRCIKHFWPIRI